MPWSFRTSRPLGRFCSKRKVGYRLLLTGTSVISAAFFSIIRTLLWAWRALLALARNRSTNFWW